MKRFLPASSPLPFSALLPGRGRSLATFPFNAPRSRWYTLGRNALWHGLGSLHLSEGDEVLIPAYNWGGEVDTVIAAGLSPRFFKVHLCLTPDLHDLQAAVSSRTRAVLVIHYFGFPQPLSELTAFCARNGLLCIEDCATALFSRQGTVSLGTGGVFSIFCPYKTLPLPQSGLLVVNDPKVDLPVEPGKSSLDGVGTLPRLLLDGLEMRHPKMIRWARRRRRRQPRDGRGSD